MPKWKGDKAVLAANRALAAEATLAEAVWRRGLARKTQGGLAGIRVRTFARAASLAAMSADTLATDAEVNGYKIAPYFRSIADQAESHAARAHTAVSKMETVRE